MKTKSLTIICFFAIYMTLGYAQVAINLDGADPDQSAMLDVQSLNKGILIPRIDFNNRPQEPPAGLLIYVSSNGPEGDNAFYYYNGAEWMKLYHYYEADYVPYEGATRTLNLSEQTIRAGFGSEFGSDDEGGALRFEQTEVNGSLLNGQTINLIRSTAGEFNMVGIQNGLLIRGHSDSDPELDSDAFIAFHKNNSGHIMAMSFTGDTLYFLMVDENSLTKPLSAYVIAAETTQITGNLNVVRQEEAYVQINIENFGESNGYMPVIRAYQMVELDESKDKVEQWTPVLLSQGLMVWDEQDIGLHGLIFASHDIEQKGMILHGYNDSINSQGFLILGDIYTFGRQTYAYKGNSEPEINEVLSLYYYGNKTPGSGSMMRFKSRRSGFDFIGSSINTAAFAGLMTDSSEENWSGSLHGYVYNAQHPVDGILFMEVDGSGKISFKNFGHKIGQDSHHIIFKEYIAENGDYAGSKMTVLQGMGDMWFDDDGNPIQLGTQSLGIGFQGYVIAMPDTSSFQGQANPAYYFWNPDIGEPGAAIEWDYFEDEQSVQGKPLVFRNGDGFLFYGDMDVRGTIIHQGGTGIVTPTLYAVLSEGNDAGNQTISNLAPPVYNKDAVNKSYVDGILYALGVIPNNFSGTITDVDGNAYKTITIGTQTWMAENLRAERFRNGDNINMVEDPTNWSNLTSAGMCFYDNDKLKFGVPYGAFYNWYAVNDSRGICPAGWRVPEISEWMALRTYLGGDQFAGVKMKEQGTKHWPPSYFGLATNESGFSGLPGGLRHKDGTYKESGRDANWWSSTEESPTTAGFISLESSSFVDILYEEKEFGLSIRCIKDPE